jgi:hypothetical protein
MHDQRLTRHWQMLWLAGSTMAQLTWLNPVAISVTLISSGGHSSSMTAPKMMLQEGSASDVTISDIVLTSERVMLLEPLMLYTTPVCGRQQPSSNHTVL